VSWKNVVGDLEGPENVLELFVSKRLGTLFFCTLKRFCSTHSVFTLCC